MQGREFLEGVLVPCPSTHHEVVQLTRMFGHRMREIAARTGTHAGERSPEMNELACWLSIVRRAGVADDPA